MRQPFKTYREWKGWGSQPFGTLDEATEGYFVAELNAAGIQSLKGLRVLEIGFGNGAFAAWCKDSGARYVGIEAIPELVEVARHAGIDAYGSKDDLTEVIEAESLGLIVAFDVFEHLALPELEELLLRCKSWLAPGGILIARVPSGDSPFARAAQYGDLTHRLVLGSSAVSQIALSAELEVQAVRSPAFPIGGLGAIAGVRRLLVSAARLVCYRFIALALMGGGSPVLTPNMVFVLRRP